LGAKHYLSQKKAFKKGKSVTGSKRVRVEKTGIFETKKKTITPQDFWTPGGEVGQDSGWGEK